MTRTPTGHGIDPRNGGFLEALGQNGLGLPDPQRARVHPRQIYAFAQAPTFCWSGDVAGIVSRGVEHFTARYWRGDGLFRSLVAVNGAVLDERTLLYDQACALPGLAGRIIEPGHQFEWAWLLLRCEPLHSAPLRDKALRLLSIGERYGVRHGVAINRLLDDFTVVDPNARFWPQTERLKAALLAATLTGEPHYWSIAHSAAMSFFPYLQTAVPGLWLDMQQPDGAFSDSPAPASTLYHLAGAVAALTTALRATA